MGVSPTTMQLDLSSNLLSVEGFEFLSSRNIFVGHHWRDEGSPKAHSLPANFRNTAFYWQSRQEIYLPELSFLYLPSEPDDWYGHSSALGALEVLVYSRKSAKKLRSLMLRPKRLFFLLSEATVRAVRAGRKTEIDLLGGLEQGLPQ